MAVAGTLEIQMRADVARISQDMTQVKGVVGGAMSSVEKSVASAKSALGALGLTLGAGALAAGFVASIKSIAAMRSALDDLSDTTGDSITMLDGLRRQGIVSGVALDQLGGALTKLSRNMNNADEEGQAAAQGIKAIGLNVETLRAMKPAEQMLEVAKALDQFADGGGKVAVATALMGKEGAKMLPYLKDLVNDGDAAGRVTAEQAAQAENLEKAMRRLQLAYSDTKDELATGLIPALAKWIESNREAIKIAGSASEAARLFVFNLDAMTSESPRQEIDRLTESLKRFQAAGSIGKFMQSPTGTIFGGRETDLQKQIDFLKFLERQQALEGRTGPQFMDARDLRLQQKPILDPGKLGGKAKEIAETESAYKSMKKTLDELLIPENERTEVGKVQATLDAMTAKKRAEFKPGEEADLLRRAALVDVMKREKDALEANVKLLELQGKLIDERADLVEADLVSQGAALVASRKTTEQIEFETTLIGKSNEARETAIALRALEKSGMDKNSSAYADQAKGLSEALASRQAAQAADDLRKRERDEWASMWSTVEQTGKSVFVAVFASGKSAFEGIGKALKASVIDLLYQMTAKKWLFQIGAGVSSSLGMASADAATTQAAGSFLGSNASSLVSGAASLFGGAATGGGLATGATTATTLAMMEAGATTTAAAGAGIMAGLAAVPVWGWAAMAALAVLSLSSKDRGPKPSELVIRGVEDGMLRLEPINVSGAGNIDANNQAYVQAAAMLSQLPAGVRDSLVGKGVTTGPSDSAEAMIQALFNVPEIMAATKAAEELAVATKAVEVADLAAAEAAIALAAERRGFDIRLMEATGDAIGALAAKREDETAASNEANRAILGQIYAAEDLATASRAAAEADQERARAAEDAERVIAQAAADALARAKAVAAERYGIETQYLQLIGDTAGLRARELAGLDESNRALQARIYALTDEQAAARALAEAAAEQAAADKQAAAEAEQAAAKIAAAAQSIAAERYSLETQLLQALGDTATLRARELEKLDATNRALQERIYAISDEAAAMQAAQQAAQEAAQAAQQAAQAQAQAAAALASERYGLETRLLQAVGNTAALRERELAGTNDLNREILRQINAQEDLKTATAAATKATEDAAAAQNQIEQERQAAVDTAVGNLRTAYQRESSDLEAMIGKWSAAGTALRAYSATLAGVGGVGAGYGAASSAFTATAASARLGDLTAIGNLQSVSETFRTASMAASATQTDYLRDIGRIQAAIADTVGVTDRQGSVAQQSLDSMRAQVSVLMTINETMRTVQQEIAALKVAMQEQERFFRNVSDGGTSLKVSVQ